MSKITLKWINNELNKDFEYGKIDCFIFTARCVKKFHGKDYLKPHINNYSDEKSAKEYMNRYPGGIEELTIGTLGYPVNPEFCLDGDVVTADLNGEKLLGFVINGNGIFKAKTRGIKIPLKKCSKGWRIH